MPELTIEAQLALYGEAVEARASEHAVIDLDPIGPDAAADRRWLPSAAALLIVLALGTAAVAAMADRSRPVVTEPEPTGTTTYVDSILGWTVEVPDGWHLHEFDETCWRGFAVLNSTRELRRPDHANCSADLLRWTTARADVAVVVQQMVRYPAPQRGPASLLDTAYPILTPALRGQWSTPIVVDGERTGTVVARWIGFDASPGDAATAQEIVASLRPPAAGERSPHEQLVPTEVESEWTARLDGQDRLVVSFVGGAPDDDPMEPCQVRCRPEVTESDGEVAIRIVGEQILVHEVDCSDEVHRRMLQVELEDPLGDRVLLDASGRAIDVYREPLLVPTWLPDSDAPWQERAGLGPLGGAWWTTYGPPEDVPCPSLGVTIGQGPPELVHPHPTSVRGEVVAVALRGTDGSLATTGGPMPMSPAPLSVWWTEPSGLGVIVTLTPLCDPDIDGTDLLRLADGLR